MHAFLISQSLNHSTFRSQSQTPKNHSRALSSFCSSPPKISLWTLPILSIKYVFILPTACHVHCQYWRATSHLPSPVLRPQPPHQMFCLYSFFLPPKPSTQQAQKAFATVSWTCISLFILGSSIALSAIPYCGLQVKLQLFLTDGGGAKGRQE